MKLPRELLLNPATELRLNAYLANPRQSLLLSGAPGAGKKFMARILADLLTEGNQASVASLAKDSKSKSIPIEQLREMLSSLSLRSIGRQKISRVIIINDAHFLSSESQNLLLKTLEEPPDASVFILTCSFKSRLLPTVLSRLEEIRIGPIQLEAALDFYAGSYSKSLTEANWHLSAGGTGLLEALLSNDQTHPLRAEVERAKHFLTAPVFERLSQVDSLSKNANLDELFYAWQRVLDAGATTNLASPSFNKKRLLLNQAVHERASGANQKLQLTKLALSL